MDKATKEAGFSGEVNRFDPNIEAFFDAADKIRRHCTQFAGHRITAPHAIWPLLVLIRVFSHCDPAADSYSFDGTAQADGHLIPCTVEVTTVGNVRFIPKH